jgi:cytidine deaminase
MQLNLDHVSTANQSLVKVVVKNRQLVTNVAERAICKNFVTEYHHTKTQIMMTEKNIEDHRITDHRQDPHTPTELHLNTAEINSKRSKES